MSADEIDIAIDSGNVAVELRGTKRTESAGGYRGGAAVKHPAHVVHRGRPDSARLAALLSSGALAAVGHGENDLGAELEVEAFLENAAIGRYAVGIAADVGQEAR